MSTSAKVGTFTLNYESTFRTPFFRIGDARPAVLETMYRALAVYGVSPDDMYSFGGNTLGHQRIRINLFRGNAYLEVSAEKLSADFKNALGKADLEIIEACIRKVLSAIETYSSDAPLGVEHITFFPELILDSEQVRNAFLQSLPYRGLIPTFATANKATVAPSYRVEMQHPENEWLLDIAVQKAWVKEKNLFVALHAYFYSGASSEKISDRSKIIQDAISSFYECIGLAVAG